MILSDRDILKAIEEDQIKIIPFEKKNLNPCSVDLTLSSQFTLFEKGKVIDSRIPIQKEKMKVVDTDGKAFEIQPGQFLLAKTIEKIAIPNNIAATLQGRSSIARLGIVVLAAGLVNPGSGFSKPVPMVLEVFCQNTSPVKLYPGTKIVQIIFHKLTSKAQRGYDEIEDSRFIGQE